MNFEEQEFYMHTLSADMCIKVIKILDQTENTANLIVEYWNLGYNGRPWQMHSGEQFAIKIGKGYKAQWKKLDPEDMTIARRNSGLPGGFNAL